MRKSYYIETRSGDRYNRAGDGQWWREGEMGGAVKASWIVDLLETLWLAEEQIAIKTKDYIDYRDGAEHLVKEQGDRAYKVAERLKLADERIEELEAQLLTADYQYSECVNKTIPAVKEEAYRAGWDNAMATFVKDLKGKGWSVQDKETELSSTYQEWLRASGDTAEG